MSETARAVSAGTGVAGRVIDRGHFIRAEEAGLTGMVTVRCDLGLPALGATLTDLVGAGLPEVRTVSRGERGRVVWMSPDELLVLCEPARADEVVEKLEARLAGEHHMVVDVSHARVVFRLSGRRVPEVLAKGAPVDLRDAAFPVGAARRTHLGEIAVGFWRTSDESWEIVCFRSVAHHLADWLAAASVEGAEIEAG